MEKFRAKAMDPALTDRLTERMVLAAARKTIKNVSAVEKAEIELATPNAPGKPNVRPRYKPNARSKSNVRLRSKPNVTKL